MGQFRITITAVGGHGCQREVKDGEVSYGCGRKDCPDCRAMEAVADFVRHTHASLESAEIVHWPGTTGEVRDEIKLKPIEGGYIVNRVRHGNF